MTTENGRRTMVKPRVEVQEVAELPDSVIGVTKRLDANSYATKKTVAQGMLDIALLTANASQLKYVLQLGQRHDFYYIMIGLISTSIVLQILIGFLALSLNMLRDCRLHLVEYKKSAEILNYTNMIGTFLISVIVGITFLVIGGMDINKEEKQRVAIILNDLIVLLIFVISVINIVISSFGIQHIDMAVLAALKSGNSTEAMSKG